MESYYHHPQLQKACELDHVGIYARSMEEVVSQYERLGFQLTPLSQHSSADPFTGEVTKLGIANRCAMLSHGYIELLAIVDSQLDKRDVGNGLARYSGLHIVAFGTQDPKGSAKRLRACGFDAHCADLRRCLDTPEGPQWARFTQVRVPRDEMPDGLILTLRHETARLLWQERYLSHPNGATALEALALAITSVEEDGPRYERYLGVRGNRFEGGMRFSLPRGALDLLEPGALSQRFDGLAPPMLPFPAAIVVRVLDLDRTQEILVQNDVPSVKAGEYIHVLPEHAAGVALAFRQNKTQLR